MTGRTAIIPAGGRGTRMLPATLAVAKELLPVGGRPAVQWALDEALAAGAERIVLVTSPDKPELVRYVVEMAGADAEILVAEQTVPRGLGDAVAIGAEAAGSAPVAVLLPDELLLGAPRLLARMFDSAERSGRSSVSLLALDDASIGAYGCAAIEGEWVDERVRVVGCVEKPDPALAPSRFALTGRYVLAADVLGELGWLLPSGRGELELTDAISRAAAATGVEGCLVREEDGRVDVGCWSGWLEANVRAFAPLAQPATDRLARRSDWLARAGDARPSGSSFVA